MKAKSDERIDRVTVTTTDLKLVLRDGRILTVPLGWFPRLQNAATEQLSRCEISGGGFVVRWPELDEDLEISGLLRGNADPSVRESVPATGESIRQYREQCGVSQADLAHQLGVRQATISDWEKGKTTPSPLAATRLADLIRRADLARQDSNFSVSISQLAEHQKMTGRTECGKAERIATTFRRQPVTLDASAYNFTDLGCSIGPKRPLPANDVNYVAQFLSMRTE